MFRPGRKLSFFLLRLKNLVKFMMFKEDKPKHRVLEARAVYMPAIIIGSLFFTYFTFAVIYPLVGILAFFVFPVVPALALLEFLHFLCDR